MFLKMEMPEKVPSTPALKGGKEKLSGKLQVKIAGNHGNWPEGIAENSPSVTTTSCWSAKRKEVDCHVNSILVG